MYSRSLYYVTSSHFHVFNQNLEYIEYNWIEYHRVYMFSQTLRDKKSARPFFFVPLSIHYVGCTKFKGQNFRCNTLREKKKMQLQIFPPFFFSIPLTPELCFQRNKVDLNQANF